MWDSVNIVVHKERCSSPDRQFNSAGTVYQFFNDTLPVTTGVEPESGADERWLDLGRDGAMEERLLQAIVERAGLSTTQDVG